MTQFTGTVAVTLKDSVLDPQGQTTLHALNSLGFQDAQDLKIGKYIVITVNSANKSMANTLIMQACEKLLYNPIIEKYNILNVVEVNSPQNKV